MVEKIADLQPAASGQAVDAVVFVDENDVVTFFSPGAEQLWGLTKDEVLGHDARRLLPGAFPADPEARTLAEQIVGSDHQMVIERQDGSRAWAIQSARRSRLGNGYCYTVLVRPLPEGARNANRVGILSLVAEMTDRGVLVAGPAFEIVYANRALREILDYPGQEPEARTLLDFLSGYGAAAFAERIEHGVLRRAPVSDEVQMRGSNGKEVWVSATITPVFDPKTSALENVVAVFADITYTRLVEELQREVLAALAADAPIKDIMALLCLKMQRLAPGVLCSILGVLPDERLTVLAAPSLPEAFSQAIEGLRIGPKVGSCGTAAFRGEPVMVEDIATDPLWEDYRDLPLPPQLKGCWSIPIKLRGGKVAGTFAFYFSELPYGAAWLESIVSACSDLCALTLERSEAKARIAMLASVDTLTGLPNRGRLIESMSDMLTTAARLEQPLAVFFIDIDHFKDVNDTLGHSTGDQLLVEMARRLKAQLRTGDVVGRLGGDEFVVLVQNCAAEEADRISRRLLEYLAAPVPAQALHLTMSASIGIAQFPEHGADAEALLKHADTAMHEAKRKGRGKAQFFTEDLNQRVQNRLVLSVALREAIQNRALKLVYQPQVSLSDGALHGVEALARWSDPVHGDVPAPRFVALAEEYGLIESMDVWAVEEACTQIARWRAAGVAVPHVSVNFSPLTFRSGEIVRIVSEALAKHGLKPSDLRVEITERVMMDQHPNSFTAARAIEALGVRIAMDDFGTGYSSLSALARLPIAELKIDRSFMLSIEQDRNAQALATAVIRIGHSLGMTVVAEGVETEAQVDLLKALGCHAVQGYYFARPLVPDDVAPWLEARAAG